MLKSTMDHRFEVSGWDAAQQFFVEWSILETPTRTAWVLHLRRRLAPEAWLFVALI